MEIKHLRIRMGWCQSELAQKLKTSLQEMEKIERGEQPLTLEQTKILEGILLKSELVNLDMISAPQNERSEG